MSSKVYTYVFNIVAENTYLIVDEATKEAALVDVGCMKESEVNVLENEISRLGVQLKMLLFTHMHFDHIWGAAYFANKYNLQPLCEEREIAATPSFSEQMRLFMLPPEDDAHDVEFAPIHEGDVLHLGETELKVLFVPGHTAGHIAFYNAKDKYVLSGDALFREEIGRTDLPGGSYPTLINSLRTQLMTLPGDTVVYSGHGPSSTIEHEKNNNPYLIR